MKSFSFFLLFVISQMLSAQQAATSMLSISFPYTGKNIYVQNPFIGEKGKMYCTILVRINGVVVMDTIEKSVFEIDLTSYTLSSNLKIEIVHHSDCKPKILNWNYEHNGLNQFSFKKIEIQNDTLCFDVVKVEKKSKFFVEQFSYNQWTIVGEIACAKSDSLQTFCYKVSANSYLNKFRLKYVEKSGSIFYSPVVDYSKR